MDDLYPHQKEVLAKIRNGKILWGGTGSGKSRVAVAYYREKESPRDVYVITTAKKRDSLDWEKEFIRYGIYKSEDATLEGVLTVDSWNNIVKYKDVKNAFFIFDEQRLVGSGAWTKAFIHITKPKQRNHWIMLSATPGDTWLDYIPVFIANGFYNSRAEFKREHVVYATYTKFPKVERYIGIAKLNRYRNQLLVHMPYDRHTIRNTYEIPVEYDKDLLKKVVKDRWNVYTDEPIKNVSEFFYTMRRVVYSHPSRLNAVRDTLKKHPKLIVFYNFDYELEILRGLSDTVTVAEWNGKKHEPIPDTDSWLYLVQYVAGAEGWNCITTDATLFYSLTYSYKNWHQAHGRIDRLNTPFKDLHYYVLLAQSEIDPEVMASLKAKKSFNEVRFAGRIRVSKV